MEACDFIAISKVNLHIGGFRRPYISLSLQINSLCQQHDDYSCWLHFGPNYAENTIDIMSLWSSYIYRKTLNINKKMKIRGTGGL